MKINKKMIKVLDKKKIKLEQKEIPILSNNRILYYSLLNSKDSDIKEKYLALSDDWIKKLKTTLTFIKKFFKKNKIPYLVVKTYKYLPYVTFDVDVLVYDKDFNKVLDLFENEGLKLEKHPGKQSLKQINCFKKGLLKIDLHKGFFWQGKTFFDEKLIWKNTRETTLSDVKVKIPSMIVEVLLNMAHILHERRYITYLDYFFLIKDIKKIDMKILIKQAEKYYWSNSLNDLLKQFEYIKKNYYNIKFPYVLPIRLSLKTFFERYSKTKYFPKFDFVYFIFTTIRYYLTNRGRMPYYRHWYQDYKIWFQSR